MNAKIAVVELGDSHDECLLSQLYALKGEGCHVTLVCTDRVRKRNPFFIPFVDSFKEVRVTGTAWGDFKKMKELIRFFRREGISKVIFNTAQGGHVRNLCLLAPRDIEFIGIIHTLKKFKGSFTQRLINRKIRKYMVLNDWFLQHIPPVKGRTVISFYPLRFPELGYEVVKPDGEFWISVIGGVENRRKDLEGSIPLMAQLPDNFKILFLGKSDPESDEVHRFREQLAEAGISGRVKIFEDFVEPELFDAYLKHTDLVWTMIHPGTPCAQEYFSNQIPGSLNVAIGYGIPMLNHAHFVREWEDLKYSVVYNFDTFPDDIEEGMKELPAIRVKLGEVKKFSAEFQEKKYLELLFNL